LVSGIKRLSHMIVSVNNSLHYLIFNVYTNVIFKNTLTDSMILFLHLSLSLCFFLNRKISACYIYYIIFILTASLYVVFFLFLFLFIFIDTTSSALHAVHDNHATLTMTLRSIELIKFPLFSSLITMCADIA
jgi:hypothetical protein